MTLPKTIFPKPTILVVLYDDAGAYTLAALGPNGELSHEIPPSDKSAVMIAVCGCGVIVKPENSDIARRVEADRETFVCSRENGRISFFRRERTAELKSDLAKRGIVPAEWFCAPNADELPRLAEIHFRRLRTSTSIRSLLRPEEVSSAILQAVVRRIRIPLLATFMILLAANAMLSPEINAERERLRATIEARERDHRLREADDAKELALIRAFGTRPPVAYAVLGHRIAASVPSEVRLTELLIEPPAKRLEAGKRLLRRERETIVKGESPSAESVARFVENLAAGGFRSVSLASVERARDEGVLKFTIEIRL